MAALGEKGDSDLAIADYDSAIRLDPGSTTAFNNRGTLWRRKKDADRAIADFTEAIRLDPTYAAAYNNRGVTWRFKDLDRAIADYSEAIRLDPGYLFAYNNRGNAYRERKTSRVRLPILPKLSGSNRRMRLLMRIAAWRIVPKRIINANRRLQPCDSSRPQALSCAEQSRTGSGPFVLMRSSVTAFTQWNPRRVRVS